MISRCYSQVMVSVVKKMTLGKVLKDKFVLDEAIEVTSTLM